MRIACNSSKSVMISMVMSMAKIIRTFVFTYKGYNRLYAFIGFGFVN